MNSFATNRRLMAPEPTQTPHMGTDVFAMLDGVVVAVVKNHPDLAVDANGSSSPAPTDADRDKANFVRVRHADGTFAEYVHFKENGVNVALGDSVAAGTTKIGSSGNSGYSSGPHLHVVVLKTAFDETANTASLVSISFKFKGSAGSGVIPGKGQK